MEISVAHPQTGSLSTVFLSELEFGNIGFYGERKTGGSPRKILGAGKRTNNKFNPHITSTPRTEPKPRWWEASALTILPSLLPSKLSPIEHVRSVP